jgi:chemotaxis protein CheX
LDPSDEVLEAFRTAVATALREMAGVEVVVRATVRASTGAELGDVSVELRLDAETAGWLILSFPSATAEALARRVLADVGEPDSGMVRDCAAELANVIAGQAKTLLFGTAYHFTLATPTVLPAGGAEVGPRSVIRFGSGAGEFALHLCPPCAAPTSADGSFLSGSDR